MTDQENEVKEGDIREGTGGLHVRVQVLRIREKVADCTLTRSGTRKALSVATLRKSYRLLSRGEVPEAARRTLVEPND